MNLGNNDRDPEALARNLERIAEANAARGIATAFVPEPNSVESRSEREPPRPRGASTTRCARSRSATASRWWRCTSRSPPSATTGFLWWDRVHLTSFGQERLAARLFAERDAWLPRTAPPSRPASRSGP